MVPVVRDLDLLVLGDVLPDLVLTGGDVVPAFGQEERIVDTGTLTLGGSSAITAHAAARLGLRTAFVGVVGDDVLGRFVLDTLRDGGVDVRGCVIDPHTATGVTVVLSKGEDRAMLTAAGTTGHLSARAVDRALLARARHIHAGALLLQPQLLRDLPSLFAEVRARGASTSFDTNWDPTGRWDGVGPLLAETDVFFPNEQELRRLAGRADEDVVSAAVAVGSAARLVAVKRGDRGALAYSEGEVVEHPGFPVAAIDPTGAGDAFDAGFIAALLEGRPTADCLALACACGALSTRGLGGISAQPTRAEAAALAAQGR